MEERPRNLKAMLSEAKDTSELMVDLAYAALYFGDPDMAEEVAEIGRSAVAIRREHDWITDVEGDEVLLPGDVLFLQGTAAGIAPLRELAGAQAWEPPQPPEDGSLSDTDRAIDVLVEMKNISEVAVGLADCALVLRDLGVAAGVSHRGGRLGQV